MARSNPKLMARSIEHVRSYPMAWCIAFVMMAIVVLIIAASLWKMHSPRDQLKITLEKIAALEQDLQQKVCAHRANNVPKYRSALELFGCIEIDVVIDPPAGGEAAVYHPPHDNHHGLTLDFLLKNEPLPTGKLWLDVKDLSKKNWAPFLDLLVRFVPEKRRGDVVIETSWSSSGVRQAAVEFRANGFLFSYYLPTEDAIACGDTVSEFCNKFREKVLQTGTQGFSHLSFDARAYPFVLMIRNDLPRAMRLLSWDITRAWPQMDIIRAVDIYIVRFPSPFST